MIPIVLLLVLLPMGVAVAAAAVALGGEDVDVGWPGGAVELAPPLPPALLSQPPAIVKQCDFYLGSVFGRDEPFVLPEEMLSTHMTVLGRTGSGKSKFLELWMREMMVAGRGFTLIDPNGDLAEDVLAFAAYRKACGDDTLWKKIHYVEPSYEMVFGYDPFQFRPAQPIPPERGAAAYRAWLHTKVDRVAEVLQRKQNQSGFEGMPRLQRVLTDVLLAVGTAVDERGRHLPLADALVLLDPGHPRHGEVLERVGPHLDDEIRAEFDRWADPQLRADRRLTETESTINRLRSFLSPVVKAIFCEQVHSLDVRGIVQRGEILLVNLRETDYFSADQAKAVGGLFIHEVLTGAASTLRERRVPHTLIIDEAPDFIGADIDRALRQCRKYLLTVCLAGQNATSFRKGDLDLVGVIVSQPGVLVSFEQRLEEDLDILAPAIFRGNYCFDELYQVMDRPDGHDFLSMDEYSESWSRATNWSDSVARSWTHTRSESSSSTVTDQKTWAEQNSRTSSRGRGNSNASGVSTTRQDSTSQSPVIRDGELARMLDTISRGNTQGRNTQESVTENSSEADGVSTTAGGGRSTARGATQGTADSYGGGDTRSDGGSASYSLSVAHKTVLVPRTREEWHPTGKLRHAIADQLEIYKCCLHAARGREAAVKFPGVREGVFVRIAEVTEKWSREDKFVAIDRMKKRIFDLHPYNVRPEVGNAAQERRLAAFLAGPEAPPAAAAEIAADAAAPGDRPARRNPFRR